jgi:hypothetical protein
MYHRVPNEFPRGMILTRSDVPLSLDAGEPALQLGTQCCFSAGCAHMAAVLGSVKVCHASHRTNVLDTHVMTRSVLSGFCGATSRERFHRGLSSLNSFMSSKSLCPTLTLTYSLRCLGVDLAAGPISTSRLLASIRNKGIFCCSSAEVVLMLSRGTGVPRLQESAHPPRTPLGP